MIARNRFAELLHRPRGRRVRCHVYVQDFAASDLHHDKDVEDVEAESRSDHEIARHNSSCMIPHKGHPALGGRTSIGGEIMGPIGAHGSWRYADAKLESQFRGDSGFTLSRILSDHFGDQGSNSLRQSRSATSGLPPPEKLECLPMPTDQSVGLNHHKCILPVKKS